MPRLKGSGNTVLIVLLAFAVVVIVACCGGGYYLYTTTTKKLQQFTEDLDIRDPARVESIRQEIASIEIPSAFKPQRATIVPLVEIKQVIYRAEANDPKSGGYLSLMEAKDQNMLQGQKSSELDLEYAGSGADEADKGPDEKSGAGKDSAKTEKDEKDKEATGKEPPKKEDADAEDDEDEKKKEVSPATPKPGLPKAGKRPKPRPDAPIKSEKREPSINGGKARFQIVQVFDADKKKLEKIEVFGEFRTKSVQHAQLKMQVTADLVTYDQVIKMIESIH